MVHVEELADELVDGVLGLQLDVHGQEEGGEEEDRAAQRDQLGRTLFDDSEAAKVLLAYIWLTFLQISTRAGDFC